MTSEERREARYQRRRLRRDAKRRDRNAACGSYDEVFSFDHLYRAYELSRRGVLWKASVQTYKAGALMNVYKAHEALANRSFKSRGFVEFDIFERGKPRHIRSVHISERVVQRCLCDNCLVPLLSSTFIHDNGASLKGKGIDFSMDRLTRHLQEHYREHGTEGYALVFDFSKYFDRADHQAIFRELERCILDAELLELSKYFVRQFGDYGLGLGSQVSQIDALALPNPLDHAVKEKLRIKRYGRYMDDGYLLHISKEFLEKCLVSIREKCRELGICLNEKKTQIVKPTKGIRFLKTRFFLTATGKVIRKLNQKSITRMRRKLRKFRGWYEEGRMSREDIETSYTSWRGHAKRCNTHDSMRSMDQYYKELYGWEAG